MKKGIFSIAVAVLGLAVLTSSASAAELRAMLADYSEKEATLQKERLNDAYIKDRLPGGGGQYNKCGDEGNAGKTQFVNVAAEHKIVLCLPRRVALTPAANDRFPLVGGPRKCIRCEDDRK